MATQNQTFTDVTGQTITVARPPDGYLVIADTKARHFVISKQMLMDTGMSASDLGQLIFNQLKRA